MATEKLRGRKAIAVVPSELQLQITKLEGEHKFTNRSSLWSAIAASDWAKTRTPRPLTAQVAMTIAKKHGLLLTTPIGKRGREKGCGPINVAGGRKRRAMPAHIAEQLKKSTRKEFHPLVEKAATGSLKAALKLHCIDCMGGSKKEVRLCEITGCALYHFRPYKGKVKPNGSLLSLPMVD